MITVQVCLALLVLAIVWHNLPLAFPQGAPHADATNNLPRKSDGDRRLHVTMTIVLRQKQRDSNGESTHEHTAPLDG